MGLTSASVESSCYCHFCGTRLSISEIHKCLDCGATFCHQCATRSLTNGNILKCTCGSKNVHASNTPKNGKADLLEQIFDLKRLLKQVGYRPVILLKRTGQLETRLRSFRKQFLIPGNLIDKIFLETKKIENFTLEEFQEYSAKLQRIYHNVVGSALSENSFRNSSLQISLFEKHINSFDQTVLSKLSNISAMIEQVEKQCDTFDEMRKNLVRCLNVFVLTPGELGIGYFPNVDLHNNGIRKISVDLIITTDRIVFIQKRRARVISHKIVKIDEFPPKALVDVQKKNSGFMKRDKLLITAVKRDFEIRANEKSLLGIYYSLKLSYYGRPTDLYINEPFRDWSSEIYQEKILAALNFQKKKNFNFSPSPESHKSERNIPDFLNGFLEELLRDLRIRELAAKKALEELKEQRKKVSSREYFDLLKQFEFELAKIREERTELLIKTGKTNLL
ncbi:MAG: hypothetical protein ACTSRJ_00935 [Candidatus Hodarchaeales archaeon]